MLTFGRLPALGRWLALVPLLAFGVGCSHGGGDTTDFGDNDSAVVVALGDSITFGIFDTGVEDCSESYRSTAGFCPRLQALSGKTVVNKGGCGEESSDGVDRIDRVLQSWKPGVILIDYSPNDIFNGSDTVIGNLRLMIASARANKTIPILGTLVPAVGSHAGWESFIEDLNPKILALCDEEEIQCADHYTAFVNDTAFISSPYSLMADDGLHPNAAGYTLMAETWNEALKRVY